MPKVAVIAGKSGLQSVFCPELLLSAISSVKNDFTLRYSQPSQYTLKLLKSAKKMMDVAEEQAATENTVPFYEPRHSEGLTHTNVSHCQNVAIYLGEPEVY